MKNVIKGSLISVVTCAVLLSLQGCGSDRAGISVAKARSLGQLNVNDVPGNNRNVTPTDSDGDGIDDSVEKQQYSNTCGDTVTSEYLTWDTDGDGLSDGYERTHSYHHDSVTQCTKPRVKDTDGDGIDDRDEILSNNGYITDPTDIDSDNDGLKDGEEVAGVNVSPFGKVYTNPLDKDSDDDGLSDGYEAKHSLTNPKNIDSDNDGVTDGIEVCGTSATNQDSTGKITSTAQSGVNPNGSNDFYDDVLDLTNDNSINYNGLLGLSDSRCQSPANINSSDSPNKIDALDATNDSDGDLRPNNSEKAHSSDPLHAGKDYDKITNTADVNNSIANNYYYPWITQTDDGIKMVNAGFVYVPKQNSKGFWISKYEARYKNNDNTQNAVVFKRDANSDGTNDSNVNDKSIDVAKSMLNDTDTQVVSTYPITMILRAQYTDLFNVKSGSSNTNCINIKNSVGDSNMPKNAESEVCEITDSNYEFVTSGDGKYKYNNGVTFTNSTNQASDTTFRGATANIQ